jgi:hypothetical protein
VAIEGHGAYRRCLALAEPGAGDRSLHAVSVGDATACTAAGGDDVDDLLLDGQRGVRGVADGAVVLEHRPAVTAAQIGGRRRLGRRQANDHRMSEDLVGHGLDPRPGAGRPVQVLWRPASDLAHDVGALPRRHRHRQLIEDLGNDHPPLGVRQLLAGGVLGPSSRRCMPTRPRC